MGYSATLTPDSASPAWLVRLKVSLTRSESNELFLSGDSMVSWPVEGMQIAPSDRPGFERSSIFVSEIAARPGGLEIRYSEQGQAERVLKLLKMQFAQIGIREED
jgi:hypothetical protein